MRLLLRVKLVKTGDSDIESAKPITLGFVNKLLHSMVISVSAPWNGNPVTLHETKFLYKAYFEKLSYGSDASDTHLVSSSLYLDSPGELRQQWLRQTVKLP